MNRVINKINVSFLYDIMLKRYEHECFKLKLLFSVTDKQRIKSFKCIDEIRFLFVACL